MLLSVVALRPGVVPAAEPSLCKLSTHSILSVTDGTMQVINAHPRLIKLLDPGGSMLAAARTYKQNTPNGKVVVRIYTTKRYTLQNDPAASATDFWSTVLAPRLTSLLPADRALIDYVEGPNESDSTPTWGTLQDTQWFNSFWVALAPLIANAGFRPCAFSIAVGNPSGDQTQMRQRIAALVPALRKCKELNGAWSYHAYTGSYSTDPNIEAWYSLRYRQFYQYFAQSYPDLVSLPLLLTEGGVDYGGNPQTSGWQAHGDAVKYQNWLTWFDNQLRQDSYVLGCTLFQIGNPGGWPSFDLEPIAPWLAARILSAAPAAINRAPDSLSATVSVGTEVSDQFFTIANGGGGTLNYTITRDAEWLNVWPSSGSSTGESDTITVQYNTLGLSPGTYTASIRIASATASNSPQFIPVTVRIEALPPVPGDFDSDRDVDAGDFDVFAGCFTGSGLGPPPPGCAPADLDRDDDVDQSDFGLFQRCLTGPAQRGDPHCAD